MLYGLSIVAGTGMLRCRAYSISSGRVIPQTRAGAIDLDLRVERARGNVEPNLIVPFARAAVGNRRRPFEMRDLDEAARDQRPAERRRERIPVLVDGARLQRRQDELARELLADVQDVRAHRADRERALADVFELAPLARGRA